MVDPSECSQQQLRSLDVPSLLLHNQRLTRIERRIRFDIVEEDIDPSDEHLGYTQVVRLLEVARYVEFERLKALHNPGQAVVDSTLVHLDISFARPLRAGDVANLSASVVSVKTHSFVVEIEIVTDDAQPAVRARLTLVALGITGHPVPAQHAWLNE